MVKRLSSQQVASLVVALSNGKLLAEEHPEIADDWRCGLSYSKLALKYLPSFSLAVGRTTVAYAVQQLISKRERKETNHGRNVSQAQKLGALTKKNSTGIFGMSDCERKLADRKGARALNLKNGHPPYDGEKRRTEFGMITEGEYVRKLDQLRLKNSWWTWKLIATHVNAIFGNNRNYASLQCSFWTAKH